MAKLESKGNFPCFNISPFCSLIRLSLSGLSTSCIPNFLIFWWPENFVQRSLSKQILLKIVFWTCKHRKDTSNNLHSHFSILRRLTGKRKQIPTVVLQTYKSIHHLMRTPISLRYLNLKWPITKKGLYLHTNAEDWREDRQLHVGTVG